MTAENNFLRDHAIKNIWCSPEQDQQYVLKPQRVTANAGTMRSYRLMWELIPMPDTTSRWHILQVGGIDPVAFNWFAKSFEWVSMLAISNDRQMQVNIHNTAGVELPRHETYYRYAQNGTLIIALRINAKLPVTWSTDIFSVRVYSNAYWDSVRSAGVARGIEVFGYTAESAALRTAFLVQYNARVAENPAPGVLAFYLNGIQRDHLVEGEIVVGDSVEYVWDASIKARYKLQIKDLPVFESTLDNKRKLLVHYSGSSLPTIDALDDVDFYIEGGGANPKRLYYHKGTLDAVRQLTHRDYSLTSANVQRYGERLQGLGSTITIDTMHVVLTVRHAGYSRPLVYEQGRVHELYKLPDAAIIDAMVGLDANVPIWRAAALEASGYTQLMSAVLNEITPTLTEQTYGYFAMAKYLADSPQPVQDPGALGYVTVPFKLMFGCTAYEYNAEGVFLGWRHHYVGERYYVEHALTRTVELISGFGGSTLDEEHGVTTASTHTDRNYKVYQRTRVGGVVQNDAKDVTGTAVYSLENNVFTWLSGSITAYPTLRSDKRFYAVDHLVTITEGQLRVNLQTLQTHANGTGWANLTIPLGQLDVILNGRSLIQGLEYFFDKGVVYITAKQYLVLPVTTPQQVHVRMAGFCQTDMTIYPEGDVGYVEHGLLSNNKRFDLRDGKVQRLVLNGKLITKDDVIFSEESEQVSVNNVLNGTPYLVKDLHVPLRPEVATDTYALLAYDQQVDQQVSDYLTLKLPQPARGPVTAVAQRYQVFSPFLCKLLFDMKYSRLVLPDRVAFTRQDVLTICQAYEYLLLVDPIGSDVINTSYVVILPHSLPTVLTVTDQQYKFMTAVVEQYAPGKVSLSASLSISG